LIEAGSLKSWWHTCFQNVRVSGTFDNNSLNAAGSSDVDVSFWNNRLNGSFDFLPQILIVECKNTAERVGSADVPVFLGKLQEMHLDHGILVAAQGITGDAESLRAAHDVIRTAYQRDKVRLIVLTRFELEALRSTNDLIRLLQDKVLLLTMRSATFHN
jgi:predicted Mrr-cat superfamily restriction endonuclease